MRQRTLLNITVPGRLHVILCGRDVRFYLTLRIFGHRFHRCWRYA
jgi:hypothetical protein